MKKKTSKRQSREDDIGISAVILLQVFFLYLVIKYYIKFYIYNYETANENRAGKYIAEKNM